MTPGEYLQKKMSFNIDSKYRRDVYLVATYLDTEYVGTKLILAIGNITVVHFG